MLPHKTGRRAGRLNRPKHKTAHEVRGTSVLGGPERSGEDSNFGARQRSEKKKDSINDTVLLFSRAQDGIRTRDPRLGKAILHH